MNYNDNNRNYAAPIGFELIENEIRNTNYVSPPPLQPSSLNYELNNNLTFDAMRNSASPVNMKEAFNDILKNNKIDNFISSQDYQSIKRSHSIRNRFVDTHFRAANDSIFYTKKYYSYLQQCGKFNHGTNVIQWKRAKDLFANQAHFVLDRRNRFIDLNRVNETNYKDSFHTTDLDQGSLGDCWFISAATGIIQNYNLFKLVVPFDNSLEDVEYTGAFHFRFWIYGSWKDVVVDDFLPVGPDNKLIFSKNRESPNEFWCALFEKAYAKMCGSYEALDGGFTTDALIDMSGGIEEVFSLKEIRRTLHGNRSEIDHNQFWHILLNARKKQSVIGSNIESLDTDQTSEVKLNNGLVRGHAYICTKLAELESIEFKDRRIMRLYNPWGNEVEWNGLWSDKSSIWNSISQDIKNRLDLRLEKDGEFWMSFEDFLENFDFCQICNLTPHIYSELTPSFSQDSRLLSNIFSMWQCQTFHEQWIPGVSSGGRGEPNFERYWRNPQVAFFINNNDLVKDNKCWVIIGLMQKYTRQKRAALLVESAEEYIQFRLFKVKDNEAYFRFIANGQPISSRYLERIDTSGAYINKREVTKRFALAEGAYIIVSSCYDENAEGEFLVRIFTEMPLNRKDCRTLERRESQISIDSDFRNLSIGDSSNNNNTHDYSRHNRNLIENPKRKRNFKPQVNCNQM